MDRLIQQLRTIAETSPESEWFTGPRAKEAHKLLSECRDMMKSLVTAYEEGGIETSYEADRHVNWARELLA